MGDRYLTTSEGRQPVRRRPPPVDERDIAPDLRAPVSTLAPHAVMALQRTAGNGAVGSLLARQQSIHGSGGAAARRSEIPADRLPSASRSRASGQASAQTVPTVVQRGKVKSGKDPLKDLDRPEARGLLYGTSTTRKETSKRLALQDAAKPSTPHRTIDAYNLAAGINAAMTNAATGIFLIREALEDADISNWATRLPSADPNLQNDDDLKAWIAALKQKKEWIGLYDLGGSRPEAQTRVPGTRFGKNLKDEPHAKGTTLTPKLISRWLRKSRKYLTASADLDRIFDASQQTDLKKWIYSAFFRRTSKLGIDFTTARGHMIHFNISGDPKWSPSQPLDTMKIKKGGLKKLHEDYGRLITSSEYHHVKKGIKQKTIPKHLVNFYDEF